MSEQIVSFVLRIGEDEYTYTGEIETMHQAAYPDEEIDADGNFVLSVPVRDPVCRIEIRNENYSVVINAREIGRMER